MTDRRWVSPLRYPGGKGRLTRFLGDMVATADVCSMMDVEIWVEPFAGGAGVACSLLAADLVGEVWLTEQNPALAAFWATVASDGTALADRVANTTPTVELWDQAQRVLADAGPDMPDDHQERFELGWAAFLVNRCSHSGIVHPSNGVLGGRTQRGPVTVRSRFHADELAGRISDIAARGNLRVDHGDGIERITELDGSVGIEDEMVLFADPPYLDAGPRLYANAFAWAEHLRLSAALAQCAAPWVCTYDAHPSVFDLFPERQVMEYDITHTAGRRHGDHEYMVFSDCLVNQVRQAGEVQVVGRSGAARWVERSGAATLW